MQPTSVFAAALSRLHADLILVRLQHGGISSDKVSAIFPERLQPNSTLGWTDGHSTGIDAGGERITVAGPLHKPVRIETETLLIRSFQKLGVDLQHACVLAERLGRDEILICVQSSNDAEISIALHTFDELKAEAIAVGNASSPASREDWSARSEAGAVLQWSPAF